MAIRRLRLTPSSFAIPLGLSGLAMAWASAAHQGVAPAWAGTTLFGLAAAVLLLLLAGYLAGAVRDPSLVARHLRDPAGGPFGALPAVTGMLLALGLAEHAPVPGRLLFGCCLGLSLAFGGWLTGQWIVHGVDREAVHSGYYLPVVGGGLIGAIGAATLDLDRVAQLSFGIGLVAWPMLEGLVLSRLLFRSRLPAGLVPTMALELGVPSVAGTAYFAMAGGRADPLAYALGGYTLLMAIVQVTLLPGYLRLAFSAGHWAFTFSYAAVAIYALRWIADLRPAGVPVLTWLVLAAITAFIAGVSGRSLIAILRRAS